MNVMLFGSRVSEDVIKMWVKMRAYWMRVGPKPSHWCPYMGGHAEGHREDRVKTEAEMEVSMSQGAPRMASNTRSWREARMAPGASRKTLQLAP